MAKKLSAQAKRMKACKGKKGAAFKKCAGLEGGGSVGDLGDLGIGELGSDIQLCNPKTGKCQTIRHSWFKKTLCGKKVRRLVSTKKRAVGKKLAKSAAAKKAQAAFKRCRAKGKVTSACMKKEMKK